MRLFRSIALIFVSFLFFQCQKEVSYVGGPDPVIVTPEPINARLQGTVLDENGQPAQGVTVKVGSQTAITDTRGYFRIMNASLDKKTSLVTAEKTGYFKALRSFAATSGTNQVMIKLIPKTLIGTIDASAGGNVSLTNGSKITLPANGVVKAAGGAAFSGTVNVYAAYIDPTAADIDQIVPGSFMATDKNGSRVILSSYGMLAVELESAAGEKLQIKSGSKATLTTAIPTSVQSSSPQTIALWSVDEATGLWKEEGTATKQGSVYVGEVSHFSFWNCDVSVNAVVVSMTVKDANNNPIVYAHVKLTRQAGTWTQTHGWTDSLGQVSGYVPNNEVLLLEVLDQCGNVIYSQNVGPFTQNTNVGTITLSNTTTNVVNVSGTLLDCNSNPVTNGMALIYLGNFTGYASTDANGHFSTSFITCTGTSAQLQILGIDNQTIVQSNITTLPLTLPATNAGNISVCGNSAQQYINYTLDGTSYVLGNNPTDSLDAYTLNDSLQTGYTTWISGFQIPSGNNNFFLRTTHLTQVAGTYPVDYIGAGNTGGQVSSIQPGSTITFTNFPTQFGLYYEGTFNVTYMVGSTTHTLTGNFRVRK